MKHFVLSNCIKRSFRNTYTALCFQCFGLMLFETFVSSVCLCHARRRVAFNLLCFLAGCSVLMFHSAALSFHLFCLVICVAFLLRPSWFPAVHFSAHTSGLVIPALSPVWSLSFVLLFMISPSSVGFLWHCIFPPSLRTFVCISGQVWFQISAVFWLSLWKTLQSVA